MSYTTSDIPNEVIICSEDKDKENEVIICSEDNTKKNNSIAYQQANGIIAYQHTNKPQRSTLTDITTNVSNNITQYHVNDIYTYSSPQNQQLCDEYAISPQDYEWFLSEM
jgi:predicted ATP-grasp superfamily ATP-dependent carboligase